MIESAVELVRAGTFPEIPFVPRYLHGKTYIALDLRKSPRHGAAKIGVQIIQ